MRRSSLPRGLRPSVSVRPFQRFIPIIPSCAHWWQPSSPTSWDCEPWELQNLGVGIHRIEAHPEHLELQYLARNGRRVTAHIPYADIPNNSAFIGNIDLVGLGFPSVGGKFVYCRGVLLIIILRGCLYLLLLL